MKSSFGNEKIDRDVLKHISDTELLKVCSINKNLWNNVCDDNFLRERLVHKYADIEKYKKENESWRNFFLRATYYVALLHERFNFQYSKGNFVEQYRYLKMHSKNLLLQAARDGKLEFVIHSLKNRVRLPAFYSDIRTAMKEARVNGHSDVVKYLESLE